MKNGATRERAFPLHFGNLKHKDFWGFLDSGIPGPSAQESHGRAHAEKVTKKKKKKKKKALAKKCAARWHENLAGNDLAPLSGLQGQATGFQGQAAFLPAGW